MGPAWTDSNNWSAGVPMEGDELLFGPSAQTAIDFDTIASPASLTFEADAPSYTIAVLQDRSLMLTGIGVINTSGLTQTLTNVGGLVRPRSGSNIYFTSSATAGNATIVNSGGMANGAGGGGVFFFDSATAGTANLSNTGGAITGANGGLMQFTSSSNAGTSTITTGGGSAPNAKGGITGFLDEASAQGATLTTNGPEVGSAFGGATRFFDSSSGGTARAVTNAGGMFDISGLTNTGMSIGSIEGGGIFALGGKILSVGGNDLSTLVGGILQDGGTSGGTGGGLTKEGAGTLTLAGANTYSGNTRVNSGTLVVALGGSLANSFVLVASNGVLTVNGLIAGTSDINGTANGTGTFGAAVTIESGATFSAAATVNGPLTVLANGVVTLSAGTLTATNGVTNNGIMRFRRGAALNVSGGSLVTNGTLDVITGTFTSPGGFVNNGILLDSRVVKIKKLDRNGGAIHVMIDSYTMHTYQLQRAAAPSAAAFSDILGLQTGTTGTTLTFTDSAPLPSQGFYRVVVDP